MLGDIVMDVGGRSLQEIAERPNMSAADEKEVKKVLRELKVRRLLHPAQCVP